MKGRCFSCSAEDHWADTCPVKARLKAEAKAAAEDPSSGNPKSPKTSPGVVNDETGYGLLDSGASAALRQGTEQEIDSAIPVTVSLAVGEMVMFRNDSGTLLVREAVQPIVPMSALPLLGCEISWSDPPFARPSSCEAPGWDS